MRGKQNGKTERDPMTYNESTVSERSKCNRLEYRSRSSWSPEVRVRSINGALQQF